MRDGGMAIAETAALWSEYQPNLETTVPIFTGQEILRLSPSAIQTYLRCPRQFFYQESLGLREEGFSAQAALGILTHRILEGFNRHFQQDYTLANLQKLTRQVFDLQTPQATLLSWGFSEVDLQPVKQLSLLQRRQVERDLLNAFDALAVQGYFEKPFKTLWVEHDLEASGDQLGSPALDRLTLYGRSDLIRERPDGSLEIIDYKTSRQSYTSVRWETNMRPLLNALTPIEWDALNHQLLFGQRDYQLPLYWLMVQALPTFAGRRIDVTIQLVRPPQGALQTADVSLTLTHEQLEAGKPYLLEFLHRGILAPIQAMTHFAALGDTQRNCPRCAYMHVCEGPQDEAEEIVYE